MLHALLHGSGTIIYRLQYTQHSPTVSMCLRPLTFIARHLAVVVVLDSSLREVRRFVRVNDLPAERVPPGGVAVVPRGGGLLVDFVDPALEPDRCTDCCCCWCSCCCWVFCDDWYEDAESSESRQCTIPVWETWMLGVHPISVTDTPTTVPLPAKQQQQPFPSQPLPCCRHAPVEPRRACPCIYV